MNDIPVILLAILPGLVISFLIFQQDKYEKEQALPLILCFALGMLITFPALRIEEWADGLGFHESESIWLTLAVALIVVALNEELFKFLALYAYPFQQKFFNEPYDGIVYSVMIAMGFATLENLMYATQYGLEITLVRAFTAVPAHGVFAIVMGYFVGKAKFEPEERVQHLLRGLLIATLFHGVYDFFILQQMSDNLMIVSIILLYGSMFFGWNLMKKHQDNSPYRPLQEDVAFEDESPQV